MPRRHNADAMNTRTLIAIETSLLLVPSLFNSGEIRKVVCTYSLYGTDRMSKILFI